MRCEQRLGGGETMRPKLAQIREEQARRDSPLRRQVMEAMLCACGERGYRKVSVQDVIERYGGYRLQFYTLFASKAECYAAAYDLHAELLCDELLGAAAARGGNWRERLVAALDALASFAVEQPLLARGLLVQVFVAGEPAMGKRSEMIERLSRAMDSARRETGSRHSPPPETAPFMIGAIESAVVSALAQGSEASLAERAMPELARIAGSLYFFGEGVRSPRPRAT
jgi:AcrR family transcriptional regulator